MTFRVGAGMWSRRARRYVARWWRGQCGTARVNWARSRPWAFAGAPPFPRVGVGRAGCLEPSHGPVAPLARSKCSQAITQQKGVFSVWRAKAPLFVLTTAFDMDGRIRYRAHLNPVSIGPAASAFGFDAPVTKSGVAFTKAAGHPDELSFVGRDAARLWRNDVGVAPACDPHG